jgi:hypothetical protein
MKKIRVVLMVAVIFIVLGIAGLASLLALNYSGFCIAEFRYVPNEEKINNVVSALAQGGVSRGFVEKDGKLVEAGAVTTLPYKTTDEFHADNPNCCQVGPVVAEGYYEPTLVRRLGGTVSDVVAVRYLRRTVDPAGTISSERVIAQFSISNCGRIVSNVSY